MPSAWRLGGLSLRALGARVWIRLGEDEILDRAAGLSYYFLFALFPALLYLTILVSLLPTPDLMDPFMDYAARVLPDDAASLLRRTFADVLRGAGGGVLSLGMLAALWGASSGMGSVMTVLNKAWGVQDPRPWWQQRLIAIALTIWFAVFTLSALLLLVFGERIGEAVAGSLGFGDVFKHFWNVLRWPALIVFLLMGVSLVYYLAPAVPRRLRWISPGSLFTLAGWLLMSFTLRVYVSSVGSYNTYGSLAGVLLLMLWLYLSSVALLLGAEIDSAIHRAWEAPTWPPIPPNAPSAPAEPERPSTTDD